LKTLPECRNKIPFYLKIFFGKAFSLNLQGVSKGSKVKPDIRYRQGFFWFNVDLARYRASLDEFTGQWWQKMWTDL